MFETDIRELSLEYSGNITSRLLDFDKISTFVIIKAYTFSTKTTFPWGNFWKKFSIKMFPKYSLDVPKIATLKEHAGNIPGILHAGWLRVVGIRI